MLERLNSLLERERTLVVSEQPGGAFLQADEKFALLATMNPSGDFGKRELSPALRNRFTEIFVDDFFALDLHSTQTLPDTSIFTIASELLQNNDLALCLLDWLRWLDL